MKYAFMSEYIIESLKYGDALYAIGDDGLYCLSKNRGKISLRYFEKHPDIRQTYYRDSACLMNNYQIPQDAFKVSWIAKLDWKYWDNLRGIGYFFV